MHARLSTLLLLGALGCSTGAPDPQGPVEGPALDSTQAALSDAQRAWCDRLRAGGEQTPWWCGGLEGPLEPPFAAACTDSEWVGYQIEAVGCPEAPSADGIWEVTVPHARSRAAQLRRFCRYRWLPNQPANLPPDVAALPDVPGLRMERDCDVVAGHAIPQAAADLMFETWQTQVELPDWNRVEPFDVAPIRVAVIDGGFGGVQGPLAPGLLSLAHPTAVGSTVRAIACPQRGQGAFCGAGTPNYNAMPYLARDDQGELGGVLGTQSHYAQAVTDAVDDWLAEPAQTRPRGLILNLSLGWDGEYDAFSALRMPGVEAYWATRYAACQGALLIAAAGNAATDTDSGPLFPAAYEALPRDCGAPAGEGVYQPLVHAVGGVDGRDLPLAITRPGSLPRLVAPASFVAVPRDTQPYFIEVPPVMSGSSMAAAATSGAAAFLWSLYPNAHPDLIMQALYHTAVPLGEQAEFGVDGQPLQEQRRISVARAFEFACPAGVIAGRCPPAASRPALPPARPAYGDARIDFAQLVALAYPNPLASDTDDDPPAQAEGLSAYFDAWSVPQPATPNCPVCGITGEKLYGQLSNSVKDHITGYPILYYKDGFGVVGVALNPLPTNDPFVVDLSEKLTGVNVLSAWLEIPAKIDGEAVITTSELAID